MLLRRGTWFTPDQQPIDPELARQIDTHHLKHFQGHSIPDGPVYFDKDSLKRPGYLLFFNCFIDHILVLTELKLDSVEIRWNSVIDITLNSSSTKSRLLRYISLGKGMYK